MATNPKDKPRPGFEPKSTIHSTFFPPVWKKGREPSAVAEESYTWKNSVIALSASPPTSLHVEATFSALEDELSDDKELSDDSEEMDDSELSEETDDSELVDEAEETELSDEETTTTDSPEETAVFEEPPLTK